MEASDVKMKAYTLWDNAIYLFSVISIATFMGHFWWPATNTGYALWSVSGAFAILSLYSGIIRRAEIQEEGSRKGMASAAAVIGCLVLLGLTFSAVWLIVPISLYP
ncbi:MAG: hypothetical protein KAW13_04200 [Dehalococcoidia bacterium]|nr:hypothetical protein [Dehalococcoidia bacterium]